MKVSAARDPLRSKTQLLGIFTGNGLPAPKWAKPVREKEMAVLLTPGLSPQRVVLAGVGSGADSFRFAAGNMAKTARELRVEEFAMALPNAPYGSEGAIREIVEGAILGLYDFDTYKAEKTVRPSPTILADTKTAPKIKKTVRRAKAAAEAVVFARDMANLPPNHCTPETLARAAKEIPGTRCTILSERELGRRGFGGIMAVGQGSRNRPRLIILEYGGGSGRPVALVGKAVTFDTGGISLKPGERMNEMKFDKCGGCNVLAITRAAAKLKIKQNIIALVPAVENMPGGGAYRPGDIVKLYGGKTAEILNTDAEGRLILADALSFAEKKYAPRVIIDFATLTGACIVALGNDTAGMVSNDDGLAAALEASSAATAEPIWRLPLNEDYQRMIKSDVADVKNMGTGKAAGTIVAAAFLREAIQDTPWAHLDIAGVAWRQQATKRSPYNPSGATGFGVRMVLDYLGA